MRHTFERAIARTVRRGRHTAVVLDAAVLFEAGWDELCDLVVFIDAPRGRRLERLAATRGWSADAVRAREAAQWPLEEKQQRADLVLKNDGAPESLDAEIGRLWERQFARRGPDERRLSPSSPGRVTGTDGLRWPADMNEPPLP